MDENIEAECDEEIARISSQAQDGLSSLPSQSSLQHFNNGGSTTFVQHRQTHDTVRHDVPRPMSWDGELSDNEVSQRV